MGPGVRGNLWEHCPGLPRVPVELLELSLALGWQGLVICALCSAPSSNWAPSPAEMPSSLGISQLSTRSSHSPELFIPLQTRSPCGADELQSCSWHKAGPSPGAAMPETLAAPWGCTDSPAQSLQGLAHPGGLSPEPGVKSVSPVQRMCIHHSQFQQEAHESRKVIGQLPGTGLILATPLGSEQARSRGKLGCK